MPEFRSKLLSLPFIMSATIAFAISHPWTPIQELVHGSSVVVVGKVLNVSPSPFVGTHWKEPFVIATVKVIEPVFGARGGKILKILTVDESNNWKRPTDKHFNYVKAGEPYLFFLKEFDEDKKYLIPVQDGVRNAERTVVVEAKKEANKKK